VARLTRHRGWHDLQDTEGGTTYKTQRVARLTRHRGWHDLQDADMRHGGASNSVAWHGGDEGLCSFLASAPVINDALPVNHALPANHPELALTRPNSL